MPIFNRRSSPRSSASSVFSRRTPSGRGGASSVLRLTQPAVARSGATVVGWLSRAAQALSPDGLPSAAMVTVRPSEFAPSQWLAGH